MSMSNESTRDGEAIGPLAFTRRSLFGPGAAGLGTFALASLLGQDAAGAPPAAAAKGVPGLPGLPHFAPKAKRVIYLLQNGAPSHVDLYDYKPELEKRRGLE